MFVHKVFVHSLQYYNFFIFCSFFSSMTFFIYDSKSKVEMEIEQK